MGPGQLCWMISDFESQWKVKYTELYMVMAQYD